MNLQQIEVHEYYRTLHPEALVIYRLPGQYVVLGNDVKRALKSIPNLQITEEGVGIMPDECHYLSAMSNGEIEVHLVQYRNDNGILDWPNVSRLKAEKMDDY